MGLFDQGRDLVGYGRHAPRVVWPENARVAVNIAIAYEEGSEYSFPAGDRRSEVLGEFGYPRDPALRDKNTESIYQYGSRAGIWRLTRIVDQYEIPCTFIACAVAIELNPAVGDYIRERGHDVCCHGWRWEEHYKLDRETEWDHMQKAIESIERHCGERPAGWFSRIQSENTRDLIVKDGGFLYDSDAFDDDLPYFVTHNGKKHLIIPYTFVYNDSRFLPGQGYSDPTSMYDHCRRALDLLWEEGATHPKMMSVGVHARWMGQAGRAHALQEFIEYAKGKGEVWFAKRADIARWWIDHHESFK